MKNNRILFYSSVKDRKLFELTGFYVEDIKALKEAGYYVNVTNNPFLFFLFWTYDIGFFYFYKKSFFPAFISFLTLKKIVFTGGTDELSPLVEVTKKNRFITKFLFVLNYLISNNCNIVSNEDFKNTSELLKSYGITEPLKLKYFPHSIDVNKFYKFPVVAKEDIICTICWMGSVSNVKRKGVDVTIAIFNKILQKNKNFKLFVVGSWGPGKDYLQKIVNDLDLNHSIYFTGEINEIDKINLLNRSKFYFQLSKYEGFGIAVIEAMALNNYIFHTGKGGLIDTVGDNGYLVNDIINIDKVVNEFLRINSELSNFESFLNENSLKVNDLYSTATRAINFKSILNDI